MADLKFVVLNGRVGSNPTKGSKDIVKSEEYPPVTMSNNKKWREKNGRPIHDGDCHFWSKQVCTCGLIHHLCPQHPGDDWYGQEWAMHERQLDRLPDPLPYVEPTKEELKER